MARLLWISLGASFALLFPVLGCGGVDGADGLFNTGGAGGAPTQTTSGPSPSGSTSSTVTTTSGVTSGATTASGSSATTGGGSATLPCGDAMCPRGGDNACCWSKFATPPAGACVQGTVDTDGCKTYVANDGLETRIECRTSAECTQGVCCAHRTYINGQNFFYDLVSCVPSCDSPSVTLCDPTNPADACPIVAGPSGPTQTVCAPSSALPPTYTVCAGG